MSSSPEPRDFSARSLVLHLIGRGDRVSAWVRDASRARDELGPDVALVASDDVDGLAAAIADADAVVHLAGAPIVGKRWTKRRKRELVASRISTAEALAEAIRRRPRPLGALISASAVGYYGDRGDEPLTEASARGEGFAAELCEQWEAAAMAVGSAADRIACLRIGIVLGRHGGALPALARATRFGLGGAIAGGAQFVPWIHLDDVVRAIAHVLVTPAIRGAVNVVGPAPVPQRELAASLRTALARHVGMPAPRFAIRALLGEAASVLSRASAPCRRSSSALAFASSSRRSRRRSTISCATSTASRCARSAATRCPRRATSRAGGRATCWRRGPSSIGRSAR